jgi:signal transduction histidine kinase/CheY-like chemotaxis protein
VSLTTAPNLLSDAVPTRLERRVALCLMGVLGLAFIVGIPIAAVQIGEVAAFIPAYEAALILCDLITATLLVGQYLRSRFVSVLILAGGYLFDSLLIFIHVLSFPNVFSPMGLMGAGVQTTAWLYVFWHAGFPIFVLGYVAVRAREERIGRLGLRRRVAAVFILALAVLSALGSGLLAYRGEHLLPVFMVGNDHSRMMTTGVAPLTWALSILAFVLLLWRRNRSVLDLWLTVVMWAWILDVGLSVVIGTNRYDMGFYLGRIYGLFAATIVLASLLLEVNRLNIDLGKTLVLAEARNAELLRSREELARAQRLEAVGQLTGGVAHDFNNLLTVVIGNLELLSYSEALSPRLQGFARAAQQAAQRGARITEQLLTFARRQISRPVYIDLNGLLTDFQSLMRQALTARVELRLTLAPEPLFVRLDTAQFEAALLNLIVNARDAMPDGGRIEITSKSEPPDASGARFVSVEVSDTGTGMTPEVAARAFEPFFTTKPVGEGSGLGLSQVYGFVTAAGGRVEIQTAPGAGCTIRMRFPLSPATVSSPAVHRRVEQRGSRVGAGETILAVEDDPDVLMLTRQRLESLGYVVMTATDAKAALDILNRRPVDLVFTDIVLPGRVSGLQLAERVRDLQPGTPVLLTSGYTGADAGDIRWPMLPKPFELADLSSSIRDMLDGARAMS